MQTETAAAPLVRNPHLDRYRYGRLDLPGHLLEVYKALCGTSYVGRYQDDEEIKAARTHLNAHPVTGDQARAEVVEKLVELCNRRRINLAGKTVLELVTEAGFEDVTGSPRLFEAVPLQTELTVRNGESWVKCGGSDVLLSFRFRDSLGRGTYRAVHLARRPDWHADAGALYLVVPA